MSGRSDGVLADGVGRSAGANSCLAGFDAAQLYPPADPGLPAVGVDVILAGQSRLMSRARRAVGGDDDTFAKQFREPVEALVREIHLLPATSHEHFAGPGGLLRQALECAVQCAQAARGRLFTPGRAAHERHALEPRWRRAAFLAGLTCGLARTLDAVVVCDDTGEAWPMDERGLVAWLAQRGLARYHLSWLAEAIPGSVSAGAAAIVDRVVPPDVMTWLNEGGDPQIARELVALAMGAPGSSGSRLGDLVAGVRQEVLRLDEARRPSRYGRLRMGHHLELHVLDAIRAKIEDGAWVLEADEEGARSGPLLRCRDGAAFLRWPEGAAAIVEELRDRGLTGVPRSSRTLLECLAGAGVLDARCDGDWLWPSPDGAAMELKFSDAHVLMPAPGARPACESAEASWAGESGRTGSQAGEAFEDLCVDRWRRAWKAEPGCDVLPLSDGRVAVSHRLTCASHPEPARLLEDLRQRGWLVRPESVEAMSPAGHVRFRDGRRPALVLTSDAARQLRLGL